MRRWPRSLLVPLSVPIWFEVFSVDIVFSYSFGTLKIFKNRSFLHIQDDIFENTDICMLQDVRISFWVDTLEKTFRNKNLCKWNRGFVKVYRYFESWKITTVSRLSFWETIEKILLLHLVSWLIDLLDLCRCPQWRLHHNQLFLFFKVCDSTHIATSTCINNL